MPVAGPLARWSAVAAGALALAVTPAAAQATFEGVVTMRIRSAQLPAEGMTMRYHVRPGGLRTEMEVGGRAFAYSILDTVRREAYSVLPELRMYTTMPFPDSAAIAAMMGTRAATAPSVTALGRRDTVAGHACELYRVVSDTLVVESCIATDFPSVLPALGRPGGPIASVAGMPNGMTLRITPQGAAHPLMEVVGIERRALDAALFALPPGYTRVETPPGLLPGVLRRP